ncbi:MAG: tetratricopeptide repeat protein [Xanthomonadales bacterium]|jgi:tetratricopeptide (TPR) repeat protein|nr:tetratricopeptide repeat protein [Xanthomonadales bacterium]
MTRSNRRLLGTAFAYALIGSVGLATSGAVLAQDEEKTKQTVAMSQQVFEGLTAAQELVEAKQYGEADSTIKALLERGDKLSPYERAQIWNLTAYSYYLQERYTDAIRAYEQVMAQPELPEALVLSTLKTKAQLQFTVEDYQGALRTVQELMSKVEEPAADVYMLMGQAYFQLGDYDSALDPIKTAVDMYKEQGNTPKENWLLLLRVIYYEKKDFPSMIGVLEELITYYPKDTYLLTLAGAHSELEDTLKQLVIVEALYEAGYLKTASHITNLANLYLLHETPYKAATLLDKEMEAGIVEENERNLRLLSQAWYTAREDEKSIPPLAQAAGLSEDGELYVRLAQSHLNLENWEEAASAVRKGLQVGGVKRNDTANVMLGMALFNQEKYEEARTAFERASRDDRSRRAAQQWIAYVDSEIKRAELMSQELPVDTRPTELDQMLQEAEAAVGGDS